MATLRGSSGSYLIGSAPPEIVWTVVRGDTAKLRVDFLENDESTHYDITNWEFASSTYDFRGDILDPLEVTVGDGYVDIVAPASLTAEWGNGYSSIVGELAFDLEATLDDGTVWTPVIGVITVLGDVSGGRL